MQKIQSFSLSRGRALAQPVESQDSQPDFGTGPGGYWRPARMIKCPQSQEPWRKYRRRSPHSVASAAMGKNGREKSSKS